MRKPRRRQEGMSHSISCKDEEWELVCKGAERAGMKPSAWFTQCALDVNPLPGRTIPLVLEEREQRNLAGAIERLAQPFSGRPESLSQLEDDVRNVLRERVRAMTQQGRFEEARIKLRKVFGEERARWIERWARKPRQRRADAEHGHMDK